MNHCFGGVLPEACDLIWTGEEEARFRMVLHRQDMGNGRREQVRNRIAPYRDHWAIYAFICHLYTEQGIQDTSRSGTYHNNKFQKIAQDAGLETAKGAEKSAGLLRNAKPLKGDGFPRMPWIVKLFFNFCRSTKPKNPKKKNGYFVYICPY